LKNCDWNLEIGAITDLVHHKEDGPAVLFDEIKVYPRATGFCRTLWLRGNVWPSLWGFRPVKRRWISSESGKKIIRRLSPSRRNSSNRARFLRTSTKTEMSIFLSFRLRCGTIRTVEGTSEPVVSILRATRMKVG